MPIEDLTKINAAKKRAENIAVADYERTQAISSRAKSEDKKISPERRKGYLADAEIWDKVAEKKELVAAIEYDVKERTQNLSDEAVAELCDQALTAKRDAEQSRRVLKEAAAKFFSTSADLKTKLEEAEELVIRRTVEWSALEHVLNLRREAKDKA